MGERLPIPGELPCVNCEYLLRGLTADQRCPERGTEIMQTLLGNRLYALSISGEHVPDRMKAAILVVSQTVFPFDAILLVHATVKAAFKRAKVPGQRVSVNAADICTEFRHHVKRFFMTRRDAELFLNRWGLRTSEDLGRIVKSMTRTGLFRASEHASPESFNGLFTLENLFQCGTDVLNSVRATTRGFPELAEIRREIARERFRPAAEAAGCTIDAIMFVSDALRLAMWRHLRS